MLGPGGSGNPETWDTTFEHSYRFAFEATAQLCNTYGFHSAQLLVPSGNLLRIVFSTEPEEEWVAVPNDVSQSVSAESWSDCADIWVPDTRRQPNYRHTLRHRSGNEYAACLMVDGVRHAILNFEGSEHDPQLDVSGLRRDISQSQLRFVLAAHALAIWGDRSRQVTTAELLNRQADASVKGRIHEARNALYAPTFSVDTAREQIAMIAESLKSGNQEAGSVVDELGAVELQLSENHQRLQDLLGSMTDWLAAARESVAPVRVKSAIERAIQNCGGSVSRPGLETKLRIGPDLPGVSCPHLDVILQILLSNTLDALATATCPQITIAAHTWKSRNRAMVALRIMDNGRGFPQHVLERKPFEAVTTKGNGHGHGLVLVERMLKECMGAGPHLRNRGEGRGASVLILVPEADGKGQRN